MINSAVGIQILLMNLTPQFYVETETLEGYQDEHLAAYNKFYRHNIEFVEILKDDKIEHHYFQIPVKCKLLTNVTRNQILRGGKKRTRHENLEDFVKNSHYAKIEMDHLA